MLIEYVAVRAVYAALVLLIVAYLVPLGRFLRFGGDERDNLKAWAMYAACLALQVALLCLGAATSAALGWGSWLLLIGMWFVLLHVDGARGQLRQALVAILWEVEDIRESGPASDPTISEQIALLERLARTALGEAQDVERLR